MPRATLTTKRLLFCKYYMQGMTMGKAYTKAGYKGVGDTAIQNASNLLKNYKVIAYLKGLNAKLEKNTIASIEEVQEYWTGYIRGTELNKEEDSETVVVAPKDRLKASELLVKSKGGFVDKIEAKEEVIIKLGGELDDLAK